PFREFASRIHRTNEELLLDDSGIEIKATSAQKILHGAMPMLEAAATKLRRCGDAQQRYILLVVHPLDQLAADVAHQPVAMTLEPPELPEGIDGLFVLWVPDQLTVWCAATDCWWQLLFEVFDPMDPPERADPDLALLQEAECELMAGIGYGEVTPYLFGVDPGLARTLDES
ncbi:MAG: hypothetical protein JWN29_874, partial [Acidimicrobiales bacterium]|nr:hypothetical protein [Acidimicrobiales bacterium]